MKKIIKISGNLPTEKEKKIYKLAERVCRLAKKDLAVEIFLIR